MALTLSGSNGVAGVDGSAGTPALQGSDSNTGIAFGSDVIIGSTGGSERFRVNSSGQFGIATTSPGAKFHVIGGTTAGSVDTAAIFTGGSGTVGSGARIYLSGTPGFETTRGAYIEGVHEASTNAHGLRFATNASTADPVERMRITSAGHVGIGVTPTYRFDVAASAGNSYIGFHENTANTADDNLYLWRMGANANSVSANFLYCQTSTTQRFGLRGNGGLANYQANNVNLSDRNTKKDIAPAAGTWDCIKEWEIVNYRYKDQPDDADLNLGVIAQQVAESCPEVITVFQQATEDEPEKLGVKEQQMYWMAIKALQEAQQRIESLETRLAALEVTP